MEGRNVHLYQQVSARLPQWHLLTPALARQNKITEMATANMSIPGRLTRSSCLSVNHLKIRSLSYTVQVLLKLLLLHWFLGHVSACKPFKGQVLCSLQFYGSPEYNLCWLYILGAHLSDTGPNGWSATCGIQIPLYSGKSSVFLRSLSRVGRGPYLGCGFWKEHVFASLPTLMQPFYFLLWKCH